MSDLKPPFIRRVVLRDYKSIRECDVALPPLTLLVGLNGSGKSNFLDALRFVSDALRSNLRNAIEQRGGVRQIIRRGDDDCRQFSIELTIALSDNRRGCFSVAVGDEQGLPSIREETCSIRGPGTLENSYRIKDGRVEIPAQYVRASSTEGTTTTLPPPPQPQRYQFYLPMVSGYPGFGEVQDHLRGMSFFNINPEVIRTETIQPQPATELAWDGRGALSTFYRLLRNDKETKERVDEYLCSILPVPVGATCSTDNTEITPHGAYFSEGHGEPFTGEPRSLYFILAIGSTLLRFHPRNISDGTLRAFGVLLALFQAKNRPPQDRLSVVGIEEPEASLHPAAASVLWDAMNEATGFTQVLGTTHSVELLDRKDVNAESLLVFEMVDGESRIGPVDQAGQSIMRDRLATAGELLRQNQLAVEPNGAKTGNAQAAHS